MKYISMLGLGPDNEGYTELDYQIDGQDKTIVTRFVQRAEIELLGKDNFENIYILCTDESHKNYYHDLYDEIRDELGIADKLINSVKIGRIDGIEGAWKLFETVNGLINHGDTLVFDLTHGWRSLSIILSTALNYLIKARNNIHLKHVFYGEKGKKSYSSPFAPGHIIDIKDFFTVHEWADGVTRLTEIADATKLAQLAQGDANHAFGNLKDEKLINALITLTETLKNIDVNRVARNTQNALDVLNASQDSSSGIEKDLLKLIENKFLPLAVNTTGHYDIDYFLHQLEIIRMLNQHKLYMQSFTVIRELIGSIGMLGASENFQKNMWDNEAADKRINFADLFVRMMTFSKEFQFKSEKDRNRYDKLANSICFQIEKIGFLENLKATTKKIKNVRDGFDHAWTGKGDKAVRKMGDIASLAQEAEMFLTSLIKRLFQKEDNKETKQQRIEHEN